jgi:ATP-dependent exoDNAse (exonuclease V) beta subunit
MPHKSDPVLGAVSYSAASTKPGVSDNGTVAIQVLPERDDEEEARQVVELIGACDPDETIAILVRSRSHASAILAALDKVKPDHPRYRYQAIKFTRLADTTVIQDLVSLTLALIQPADRLAWLATLRAPYVGLDLADLDTLVAGNSGAIILDAICSVINGGGQFTLSANGQQRIQRTGPVLLTAVDRRGRQSVRSMVEAAWIALGGPACVDNASELDDAATYFDLLDALEDESLPIDRDTLDQRMMELYAEPDADADGKLQVLTIYSAKGLQFDTVILPGLNREPAGDKNKLLHWFELAGKNRIVMSPMRNTEEKEQKKKSGDLIKFISAVEKQRQSLENGRLLYVACTRAVHSLHLFAAIKPAANDVIKAASSSLMAGLWPAIEETHTPLIRQAAEDLLEAAGQKAFAGEQTPRPVLPQDYRRLDADWQLPVPPESVRLAKNETVETLDYIEFNWAGEDARFTGNLVHRLLQLISEQGLAAWETGGGLSRHLGWCRRQLAHEGVREEKAETIITRASRAIENCLASEQGRWILENHEDARCEYAITAVLEKTGQGSVRPRNLVLDRTFVDNGTRWIIDYKTSSHSGGDLEGFLENEIQRYREQLQGYSRAIALAETRPIKTALYFPLLDRLCVIED